MHLLTYKAVSEYIALAGANGLWRLVHWKKTCLYLLLTYKGVSVCSVSHRKTCLCAAWHLLFHYFDWNMVRVHSKRRHADVSAYNFWHMSACISVTWPTCLHARCLTKYVLTHKFSPLTWFLCCWDQTRCSVLNQLKLVCNLVLPPTLGLSCSNWRIELYFPVLWNLMIFWAHNANLFQTRVNVYRRPDAETGS